MRSLTLGDMKLVLRALLTDSLDDLRASATGRLYEPRLRAKKEAIDALPEAALSRSPFSEELGAADGVHDGVGTAVFHLCEAILAHPEVSAELKRTAEVARGTFIPMLANLRQPFADEAATALSNRPKLARMKASLKTVQVPGGGSLFDWVKAFVDAGDSIDGLLRKRAQALATADDASGTAALRGGTMGLLMRFREALKDEMADDGTKLATGHEASLFAYLDKLASDRAAKGGRESADDAEDETLPDVAGAGPANGAVAGAPAAPPA